jgi:hypothetical protein
MIRQMAVPDHVGMGVAFGPIHRSTRGAAIPASCGVSVGLRSPEESEIVAQQSIFHRSCLDRAAPTPVLLIEYVPAKEEKKLVSLLRGLRGLNTLF